MTNANFEHEPCMVCVVLETVRPWKVRVRNSQDRMSDVVDTLFQIMTVKSSVFWQ